MSNPTSELTSPPAVDIARLRQAVVAHYGMIPPGDQFRMLAVTCGLPRSGKTTWAMKQNVPMVDPDCVRLAFQGRPYIRETEEWVWSIVRTMVRSLFYAGHQNVIVQGANALPGHRQQWMANDLWFPAFCVFNTPMNVCLERAKNNARHDLMAVIPQINKVWSPPKASEGAVVIIP